jgi:radical SAM protein with 4Fe4S-binding SPASM domain
MSYIEEKCDRIAHYDILTNGTLITSDDIDVLKGFKKLRRIQVSLEGANSRSHDAVRGKGDFEKVVSAIKMLKANGFKMSVMTTLTKNNRNEIPELINLLSELKVDYFALERFMPEGQGESNTSWTLTKEETKETFEYMTEMATKVKVPNLLLYRTLYCLCNKSCDETVGAMCSAGVSALTILPDATMLPCRRLPVPIGNVLKDGIISTWYNSEVLWKLRDYSAYKGKCNGCEHFLECRGCRSMAYLSTGDYMQEDPQCWK